MGRRKPPRGVEPRQETIRITFQYQGRRCRESLQLDPTKPANVKFAARLRDEILSRIGRGTFVYAEYFPDSPRANPAGPDRRTLVRDYFPRWLDRQRPRVKASTLRSYTNIVEIIVEQFGRYRIGQLSRVAVAEWLVNRGTSRKWGSNITSVLRLATSDALEEGLVDSNPFADWRYRVPGAPATKPAVDPFTTEECTAILDALGEGPGRELVRFALWTGLRTSELVALRWSDVDFEGGLVHVQRAKTQPADAPETTKTAAGNRRVKLLPPARSALMAMRAYTRLKGGEIFVDPRSGDPWTGDEPIRRALWAPALRRAGVRYRRPYQCRHTYASRMLSAGEPLAWVSAQLGHSSVLITAQIYARWIPDAIPEAGDRAVALFGDEGA